MKFGRPVKKVIQKPVLPAHQPIPHFEGVLERLVDLSAEMKEHLENSSRPVLPRCTLGCLRDHSDTEVCPLEFGDLGTGSSFMSANVNMWAGQRLSGHSLWPQKIPVSGRACTSRILRGKHACLWGQPEIPQKLSLKWLLTKRAIWRGKVIPTGIPCEGYSVGSRRLRGAEGFRELTRGGNSHLGIRRSPKSAPWEKITSLWHETFRRYRCQIISGEVRTFSPLPQVGFPRSKPWDEDTVKGFIVKYSQEKPVREWGTGKGKVHCQAESHRVEFQLQADPAWCSGM